MRNLVSVRSAHECPFGTLVSVSVAQDRYVKGGLSVRCVPLLNTCFVFLPSVQSCDPPPFPWFQPLWHSLNLFPFLFPPRRGEPRAGLGFVSQGDDSPPFHAPTPTLFYTPIVFRPFTHRQQNTQEEVAEEG
eukprot:Hpha_TRINITY_DN14888_c0_g1::TRINITY_DN14888_c0_g1_i2::g.170104::m.170104